jgi:N-acetylneuraminic acid mutarotase
VWTGTEMIVWGGQQGSVLNTGGRYNPSTDSWVATSTGSNVPTQRFVHAAVWTGNKMIVWGGAGSSNGTANLNTGGRYDPSNDSWTPTSVGANVPEQRGGPRAVWTAAR